MSEKSQSDEMIKQLQRELATTRENLEKSMREMQTANDALKSSSEELLSTTEELRSAKEELRTSKKEIQAALARGNEVGQSLRQRQLADSVRDEEVLKSAILESALDCVITMDTAGRIVDFNPAAERTFGYSESEVVGQSLAHTIIPKEFRGAHHQGLARFLSTGKSEMLGRRIELTAKRADESLFPVELAISVSRSRDGSPFFTGYLRDITERKQAEAILVQRAELAALHASLAVSLAGEAPLNEILNTCCQRIVEGLDAAFARVWLLTKQDRVLELVASAGMYTHLDGPHSRVPLGELKIGRIAATQQPLLTNDVAHDPNIGDPQWAAREGMVAFAGYPLVVEHRVVGVVALFAKHPLATEVFEQLMPMADGMAQCIARKASDQRLLEREQRLNLALDAGRLGTWYWDISADRVTWSGQLYEIFGYTQGQFPNTRAAFLEIIHSDDRRYVIEQLKAVFAGNCESYEMDFRIIRGDDQQIIWTSGRGVIHRDELNRPLSITAVASDITDRKRWELELTDRESQLRRVIEEQRSITRRLEMAMRAGGMAAWEWTPTKSIWTPELYELLGIDSDQEANPELFFSLVHPDDVNVLKESWERATEGSDTYHSEFRIIRPDHQVRWLNGLGEVVRDQDGKVVGMYGVNWDSTQDHLQAEALRESERRAHEASASKSEFLANMSHEIRTPMTAILGYAELLKELVDHEEAKQHLQTIRHNGDYLLEIINDILDLSKIEAGKLDVESERFGPYRLIEDVRSIMEVRAKEGGLTLKVQYDGKLPKMIQSDAKRLKQILINLVGNAIKFTRQGRVQIRVRFEASLRQLQFDVIDTGIGISDQQMDKLFKPFSQGDASVTRNFGGTGLGLVISQRLAEMLGGTITASSTEGVGSTFTVRIATGETAASNLIEYGSLRAGHGTEKATSDGEPNKLSCHVLVVDDRRDIRFLSKRILTKAGATVDECEDGLLAVEHIKACLAKRSCPDLILLDMQMPNLDGYSTAHRLRTIGYTGPIIALTADAMQGDMNKCLEAGCNDYLSKPIDSERLIELMRELMYERERPDGSDQT